MNGRFAMDFKQFVDMIEIMTCVMSVETKEDGSYGDIRIVTGNPQYIASIEMTDNSMPEMLTKKFVDLNRNILPENREVFFEPTSGAGEYFIYYLPYRERKGSSEGRHQPKWNDYFPPDYSEGKKWLDSFDAFRPPVKADVLRFESRTAFEAWTPMGLRATAAETAAIRQAHPENPVVFTEDTKPRSGVTVQLPIVYSCQH